MHIVEVVYFTLMEKPVFVIGDLRWAECVFGVRWSCCTRSFARLASHHATAQMQPYAQDQDRLQKLLRAIFLPIWRGYDLDERRQNTFLNTPALEWVTSLVSIANVFDMAVVALVDPNA